MSVIAVAEIIGMVATVIKQAVDLGPIVIKAASDAKPFAEVIVNALRGKTITQDDLTAIEQQIAVLSAQLQQPLPPEQPDDI